MPDSGPDSGPGSGPANAPSNKGPSASRRRLPVDVAPPPPGIGDIHRVAQRMPHLARFHPVLDRLLDGSVTQGSQHLVGRQGPAIDRSKDLVDKLPEFSISHALGCHAPGAPVTSRRPSARLMSAAPATMTVCRPPSRPSPASSAGTVRRPRAGLARWPQRSRPGGWALSACEPSTATTPCWGRPVSTGPRHSRRSSGGSDPVSTPTPSGLRLRQGSGSAAELRNT